MALVSVTVFLILHICQSKHQLKTVLVGNIPAAQLPGPNNAKVTELISRDILTKFKS